MVSLTTKSKCKKGQRKARNFPSLIPLVYSNPVVFIAIVKKEKAQASSCLMKRIGKSVPESVTFRPTKKVDFISVEAKLDKQHFSELSLAEYEKIFRELYKPVRNFIYYRCADADVAEDLAQDVFLKLWENRGRIDKKTVKAFVYTIAQNLTINSLKRKQLYYKFIKKPSAQYDGDTPEKIQEMKEYEKRLTEVIGGLTEGGREVFLMNRLEDLTYNEIADRLSLSVKAVEKRMSKVLKEIREKLGVDI